MKKFLFRLAILCSIFFMVNVSAEESVISIESLMIEDKSDNVILNKEMTIDGNSIKSNLSFKDKNDYIIYKLILKNNSDPTSYNNAFNNAATKSGSGITVDYTSSVTNIDNIIATKSSNSNVLKGNLMLN